MPRVGTFKRVRDGGDEDSPAEKPTAVGDGASLRVPPAVRALAHKLNVDLTLVTPSGPEGTITHADVERVHRVLAEVGPLEKLRGPRRAMATGMAQSRDEVMHATVTDDAVLQAWRGKPDVTLRLIRAVVAGVTAEPALNAWFDGREIGRRVLAKVHLGVVVDTPEGQFVAVMQDVGNRDAGSLRKGLDKMKSDIEARTIPAEELRGYTIALSNFGRYGGRYATPAIVPPTVANVAAGRLREAVVPVQGQPTVAKILPLSVVFDQRAVNGGEAARFLAAMVDDLEKAS